ncbi:MAG: hypothetical protein LBN96_06460 [Desulfovibrio sp.]|jgi:hypothetical protein|nr:hypothetical protein [Desulfovibrio sp.]
MYYIYARATTATARQAETKRIAPSLKEGVAGMPGPAGRQAAISLKGELSDHKGIFDELGLG